jgi:beta-glucosidase
MVMVPFEYERFIRAVNVGVESELIPASRIDDACHRILRVKAALGLFEHPHGDGGLLARIGSEAHRAVAREAVSKSQVLLKNEGAVLPLSPEVSRLLIAGEAADDIGLQCGGWTIEWQGGRGAITPGTTLLEGITETVARGTSITYQPGGEFEGIHGDVGIVVLSEPPYGEGEGDSDDLSLSVEEIALVARVRRHCKVLVLVIYSGRPLIIGDVLESCDAIVASWLPGTEGRGIADVLFGKDPFTGRLPYVWPASMEQLRSPSSRAPLFPLSFGLTTVRRDDVDPAHEGVA